MHFTEQYYDTELSEVVMSMNTEYFEVHVAISVSQELQNMHTNTL